MVPGTNSDASHHIMSETKKPRTSINGLLWWNIPGIKTGYDVDIIRHYSSSSRSTTANSLWHHTLPCTQQQHHSCHHTGHCVIAKDVRRQHFHPPYWRTATLPWHALTDIKLLHYRLEHSVLNPWQCTFRLAWHVSWHLWWNITSLHYES